MTNARYGSVPPPPPPASPTPIPTHWQPYPAQRRRRRRVPGWIVAVGAATSVAAVVSFFTVLLWPGSDGQKPAGPLEFQRFGSVTRIDFGQPSHTTLTSVEGDNGYTAWEQGGDLHVVAFDVASGDERWRQVVSGPSQWSRLLAAPGTLLVLALEDDDTEPRRMFVLDSETGAQRWHKDVRGDDLVFFLEGALGWLDHEGRALRALDLASGAERWRHEFPNEEDSNAVAVLNQADLARPSNLVGEPGPGIGDHRIVMVNPDRSVWTIDGNTGQILSEGSNRASPDDLLLGYGERLFVAPNEVDYQVVSYDLLQLSGVPQVHYTPPDQDRYPVMVEPCGTGRVCLLESDQFDSEQTDVVAVNAVDGGEIWRASAPEAERLLGVGDWAVTVASLTYQPTVQVFDETGNTAREKPGLPVRLNDANLLIVTTAGGYEDYLEAVGVAIDNGEEVGLGRLPEGIEQEQCSWNERHLVCPDRAGAEVWQFARE
jgi:outer membrane protein assembly factor BamB